VPDRPPDTDEDRRYLNSLGYAQELQRGLGTFSNFAISFSIISILSGGFTAFYVGAIYGGPLAISIGWVVVGGFVLCVGMALGEICSAYPTAGGLYYWSARLATRNAARWAWFTGWFNFFGQIGVIASVDFALANYVVAFVNLFSGARGPLVRPTPLTVFVVFLAILGVHGLLNVFGVRIVKLLGDVSVWWHVLGVGVIFGVLFLGPHQRQPLSYLFRFENNSAWHGRFSTIYVLMLGLLLAQYTITGFDASAHVSEETVDARTAAPRAIVRSIYVSVLAGLLLCWGFLLAVRNGPGGHDSLGAIANSNFITAPVAIIVRSGLDPVLVKLLVLITVVGQFFCGSAAVTANSRMVYAFSRDGGLPASRLWHRINPRTRTPTNAVWFGIAIAACAGSLSLVQHDGYAVAFFALTGIATIGLFVSYMIPIALRLRSPHFEPGPFSLGRWSRPVGWISVAWVAFVSVLFVCPLDPRWRWWLPDEINTANFTGPVLVAGTVAIGLWWCLSARRWFTGPKVQGTPEELRAIEDELDRLADR